MKTPRLFSATAAVAVGLALLSSGDGSVAGWYDELEIPGATITSGELRVEEISTTVTADDSMVTAVATSEVHVEGDALTAHLALDLAGFTLADGSVPAGLTVQLVSSDVRLSTDDRSWQVDETYDNATLTAWITLPASSARAITGQPRVTWSLSQAAPGQRWSSEAVHEISYAPLWPAAPVFPTVACTPGGDDLITFTWSSTEGEDVIWEVVSRNSPGNNPSVVETVIVRTVDADGRTIYSATVETRNANWLYSVRATYADGRPPEESAPVTLTSCAGFQHLS